MNNPGLISQIEAIIGTSLYEAKKRVNDPLGGLKPYKKDTPKYEYEGNHLLGLNLANTGLTGAQWEEIVDLLGSKAANLQVLNLSENQLKTFTLSAEMKSLRWLNLSDNGSLTKIEFEGRMPNVEVLDLGRCKLAEFPPSFTRNLPTLKNLFLQGNPISNISRDTFDKPGNVLAEVRNTFQAIEKDGAIPNDQIKLILLGNSTAGKSSLIDFLDKGIFEEDRSSTHGITIFTWKPFKDDPEATADQKNLKVAVWDFGGQEFYHATHSLFFSDNALFLVLYEKETNLQGKKATEIYLYEDGEKALKNVDLEHFPYTYWLDNINHLTDNEKVPIMMAQNKCDLPGMVEVDDNCKQRFGLKSQEHLFHISVKDAFTKKESGKEDYRFEGFREKLLEYIKKHIATFPNSKKWQEIKNTLQEEWKADHVLSLDEYTRRCAEIKPTISKEPSELGESELVTLTRQLHNLGVLQHYEAIPDLTDKVFVDPAWLADCVYRVLDYKVMRDRGQFYYSYIEKIAKTIDGIDAKGLLALLEYFKLIFELERFGERFFVAPQYLPEQFNPETQMTVESFEITCQITHCFTLSYPDFLPASTFLNFLVIYGNLQLNYWYNKNELVFVKNSKVVMAKCVRTAEKRYISIHIQDGDDSLTAEIFQELLRIDSNPLIEVSIDGEEFDPLAEIQNPKYEKIYQGKYGVMMQRLKEAPQEKESLKGKNIRVRQALQHSNAYALLIGIRYSHWAANHRLNGPLNDIRDLNAHFLDPKKAAFKPENITLLTEETATASNILNELDLLAQKVQKNANSSVLVYFSGHGETNGQEHFLVPYDFDLSRWHSSKMRNPHNIVSSKVFTQKLDAIQAKKCLVILDCCHAAAMPVDKSLAEDESFSSAHFIKGFINDLDEPVMVEKGLVEEVSKGAGRVILTSCKAEQKSLDLGSNGLFTKVLLECLEGTSNLKNDGWVRLIDLMDYVPKEVKKRALARQRSQEPIFNDIKGQSAEDFIICAYDIEKAKGLEATGIEEASSKKAEDLPENCHVLKKRLQTLLNDQQHHGVAKILQQIEASGYVYDRTLLMQIRDMLSPMSLNIMAKVIVTSTYALISTLEDK